MTDIDYENNKELFLDKLTGFIRNQTRHTPQTCIEKLRQYITEYSSHYNDGKSDEDMIGLLRKDISWYESILSSHKILKKKVQLNEQKKIQKDVTALQFKYQTSLWRKLFNQRSFNNELYGQALLHITLGVITDLKVPVKSGQFIWARPSLFFIQRSRSGKNEGMYFVEDVLAGFYKKVIANGKIAKHRKIQVLRVGKKTDPTLLNRYAMVSKKGMAEVKRDADGDPVVIKGDLEKSDLVWYPEANFLLNPTDYNQEEINIHLNLLETDGIYKKELSQWGGLATTTKGGNYALVALTRPLENIRRHIAYNGLLQRCVFMPRYLTRQERRDMLQEVALHALTTAKKRNDYQSEFSKLVKELEDIQDFVLAHPPRPRDRDIEVFISELHKKLMFFDADIQKECSVESNKDIFEDFIANYTNLMLMIAFQSAAIRKSEWVELVDLEYAFNFYARTYTMMKPWIEENIQATMDESMKYKKRKSCLFMLKTMAAGKTLRVIDVINHLKKNLRVSYPTAKNIAVTFSENGPNKIMAVDWAKREVVFLE